jgi:hypothetical protein
MVTPHEMIPRTQPLASSWQVGLLDVVSSWLTWSTFRTCRSAGLNYNGSSPGSAGERRKFDISSIRLPKHEGQGTTLGSFEIGMFD